VRLATLTVLAAVWAAAAYFLWTTTRVPDGLHLSGLPEGRFFGAGSIHRAEHYESFFYWLVLGQTVATVVAFALYAWRGARFTRESAAGPIGTGMMLAMLGFGLAWLVTVPFEVLKNEVLDTAERMLKADPSIGAIVCECTNITPYSHEINRRLGVPVFDMVTLVHWFHRALRPQRFPQD